MNNPRDLVIHERRRLFDDFFKIDELRLSHRQLDGSMSPELRRLIFERGDSVAVLLFNADSQEVLITNQLKAPTYQKGREKGWITEALAGIVRNGETPEQTAIRETREESGYQIAAPQLISTFFSSPGGSSERIFLYFAEVRDADKKSEGGGDKREGEDIEIVRLKVRALFDQLEAGVIEDPKLIIGAHWLKDRMRLRSGPLSPSTIRFAMHQDPKLIIGYKTGPILKVRDVDVWVNSENTDLIMDRFIGKTISANIRYGGAEKDDDEQIVEDTVADALREKLDRRRHVRIGTVIETEPGELSTTNHVNRILHVASVKSGGPGQGVKADPSELARCAEKVLGAAHKRNRGFRMWGNRDRSILIPMMGAGDGGLNAAQVAPILVSTAVEFFQQNPDTDLKEIYLIAYSAVEKEACDSALAARPELYREP